MEEKEQILKVSGFVELPERGLWVNANRRLAISEEALRYHDVEWLTERLLEDVPEQEFRFHTNRATSEEECHKILAEMRISHLIPVNRRWI